MSLPTIYPEGPKLKGLNRIPRTHNTLHSDVTKYLELYLTEITKESETHSCRLI